MKNNLIKNISLGLALLISISSILKSQEKLYPNLFPLQDVTLLEGPFQRARDLNIKVLLEYNVDRLLAPYRKEAGLKLKAPCYPNWDGLDGHVGGHYLSAMAMNYAATRNLDCKQRMEYMLAELKICQDSNAINNPEWGINYIGGMPNSKEIWNNLKNGDFTVYKSSWAPLYNLHKMFAGLRDAWLYTGNEISKEMFLKFCDWAINITLELSDEQMQIMLDSEHGGMNEVFADAYQITNDVKYIKAAKRFSHNKFLDPLSQKIDNLDNAHANTQIPKFIGFQRIAEITGDKKFADASSYFWETVTKNRTLVFGGNSRKEHFPTVKASKDYIIDIDGPESCNSYNMLKLTEDLFRSYKSAKYIDYYERTLYNHILSTQHPEHGGYVYFTPARPKHYRVYSAPNEAMWCCVGTGMENHGKYNQLIYTHHNDSLFVNLFIASELDWKEKQIKIKQETNFPYEEKTKLIITEGSSKFKLMIRYPSWVKEGELKVLINGETFPVTASSSSYFAIERLWNIGDTLEIFLPMHNSIESLPNISEYIAFLHGPILLGAKTGTEDLAGLIADDGRWSQYASGKRLPLDKSPIIISDDIKNLSNKLISVENKPFTFKFSDINLINPIEIILEPFFKIHDSRYMMYWMALTNSQYESRIDSIAADEKAKLALENRTLDFVAPGQQQPETDHLMQFSNSNKGVFFDEFWRDAKDGGYFSYSLATKGEDNLSLVIRYYGYEWGNRKFDIFIDDEKLISEDNTGRWYQSEFIDVEYKIPNSIIEDKEFVRIKFQALPKSTAGAVYFVRLIK
ncbi:MAG: glycoside hydrolase family 127 protein [Ignavibacteriae bacterium]|nr:glycoside hydrolase family 127 protein [Ignavibacteriota bacterium]